MSEKPLDLIDLIVMAGYMSLTLCIGLYFTRSQKGNEDFFVASRSMHWMPLFCSIWASLTSANSLLGAPGYAFSHDLQMIWQPIGGIVAAIIIVRGVLPTLYGLKLISAYSYLERRYNLAVRLSGSSLFILVRGGWLASVIFAPSVAIHAVVGIPLHLCILGVGLTTTAYTCLGGMKAVIWTDVLQFFIMNTGMLMIWYTALSQIDGGAVTVWRVAAEHGRNLTLNFDWDLTATVTFWWVMLGSIMGRLTDAGSDQVALQRYFSARSFKDSRRAILVNAWADVPLMSILALTGTILFVFYQQQPDRLAPQITPDQVLPFFVAQELPIGISGLFIAVLLAATQSSVSSGINCLSAACIEDFYRRLIRPYATDRHYLGASRIFTVIWGVAATLGALFLDRLGQIYLIPVQLMNFFAGPLTGIFILGFFSRRATAIGVLGGAVGGAGLTVVVALVLGWSPFIWALCGFIPTVVLGLLFSHLSSPPTQDQIVGLTVWSRRSFELDASHSQQR